MNYWYIGFIVFIVAFLLGLFIWFSKRDEDEEEEKEQQLLRSEPVVPPRTTEYVMPQISSGDYRLYDRFINEYDDGSLEFKDINYRPGAALTCEFGIAEGYKIVGGKLQWGWVRLHSGVDRARAQKRSDIDDVVMSPFDFDSSAFVDYDGKICGSLVSLFNKRYQFEFRIAHMHPKKDILPWTLSQLQAKNRIGRDWYLGGAGYYGIGSGAHTHTEIKSLDEKCEVFEILLEEKFGDKAHKEYSSTEVIKEYRNHERWKDANSRDILKDWEEWKKIRRATFANNYLYRFFDWDGKIKTRYNSFLLFNGL